MLALGTAPHASSGLVTPPGPISVTYSTSTPLQYVTLSGFQAFQNVLQKQANTTEEKVTFEIKTCF